MKSAALLPIACQISMRRGLNVSEMVSYLPENGAGEWSGTVISALAEPYCTHRTTHGLKRCHQPSCRAGLPARYALCSPATNVHSDSISELAACAERRRTSALLWH
jgi:hypothetical protein